MANITSKCNLWMPASDEERQLVRDELEQIVASLPFRNSRRYPALLRYVVEQTLTGNVEDLKERTIGIEVFLRLPSYDTNADPVVRFTAGEVRRRIAQFYRDGNNHGPVEITLAVGSYVPQFRLRSSMPVLCEPEETSQEPPTDALHPAAGKSTSRSEVRYLRPSLAIGASLILLLLAGLIVHFSLPTLPPIMEVWNPLLKNPDSVLISAGRPHVEQQKAPEPADTTISQHFWHRLRFSFSSVVAISQVSGFLYSQHKDFHVYEASSNSLQDLHGRPVILVNAYNNKWTVLLLQPLRFHFAQTSGDFSYIEDSEHPDNRDWNIDFSKPYLQQTLAARGASRILKGHDFSRAVNT